MLLILLHASLHQFRLNTIAPSLDIINSLQMISAVVFGDCASILHSSLALKTVSLDSNRRKSNNMKQNIRTEEQERQRGRTGKRGRSR